MHRAGHQNFRLTETAAHFVNRKTASLQSLFSCESLGLSSDARRRGLELSSPSLLPPSSNHSLIHHPTMAPRSIPTDTTTILPPLLSLVQSNAYSAHQKTRTTSARLISHGHPDEAITVLFEVAKALLKTGEVGSGVDLSTAMLAAYDGKAEKVTEVSRGECGMNRRREGTSS